MLETTMDATAQQRWWELHVRGARGEMLTTDERTFYEASLRQLDENERLGPLQSAKQARDNLHRLEAERTRLEERRQELDGEIKALESKLGQPARQALGAGGRQGPCK